MTNPVGARLELTKDNLADVSLHSGGMKYDSEGTSAVSHLFS